MSLDVSESGESASKKLEKVGDLVEIAGTQRPLTAVMAGGERVQPTGLLNDAGWQREISSKDWEEVLVEPEDKEMLRLLRVRTQTGRPLASDSFMSKVEVFLGRRVRPLPVGRQRGWRKDKESGSGHAQCKQTVTPVIPWTGGGIGLWAGLSFLRAKLVLTASGDRATITGRQLMVDKLRSI